MNRITILLIIISFSACGSIKPNSNNILTGIESMKSADENANAMRNYSTLQKNYGKEWKFNKKDKTAPPLLGISFSGGGMRSATFSIGVMQGLHDIGVLDQTDIMSSVSGGSYALSWYYLQNYYARKNAQFTDEKLFDKEGLYQQYLQKNGELMGFTDDNLFRRIDYVGYAGATLAWIPVNLFFNGIFGAHANVVPARSVYQNGIERMYHVDPTSKNQDFIEGRTLGVPTGVKNQVQFADLKGLIEREKNPLPYFIINTTAHIDDDIVKAEGKRRKSIYKHTIFEFTPIRYGSDYYGYHENELPISFNKSIAISGAAADSKTIGKPVWSMLASAGNIDLGYYIDNYKLPSDSARTLPKLLPLPLYFLSNRHQKDISGTSIYLADGGHSDNLGAYSLVRRMTKNIIIVDAEHDPTFMFKAYRDLQEAVEDELGAKLQVKEIDKLLEDREPLIAAFKKSHPNLNYEDAAKAVAKTLCGNGECFGESPVLEGKISSFPYSKESGKANYNVVQLRVIYVKLSIDENRVDTACMTDETMEKCGLKRNKNSTAAYKTTISNYYKGHCDPNTNHVTTHGAFPQQATSDQTFQPDQYQAYRDLGHGIITENKHMFKSQINLTPF